MTTKFPAKFPAYEELLADAIKSLAVDSGLVSSPVNAGGNALTDSTKNWAGDVHKNRLVKIIRGSGVGQLAVIDGNSSNTLRIKGSWPQGILAGAVYVILGMDLVQVFKEAFQVAYDGIPYSNTDTATDDTARRFEAGTLILRDAVIKVSTNSQLFGDADGQNFELAAGGSVGISFLDLSLFYFRNATAGLNGTVQIFGTRC